MSQQPEREEPVTDQSGGPIGAARRAAAEHETRAASRLPFDQMTERDLARLYQRVEIAEAVARDLDGATNVAVRAIQLMNDAGSERDAAEQRAEQAEAKLAALKTAHVAMAEQAGRDQAALHRVREFLDQDQDGLCCSRLAGQVRAALTEPKEPAP
ncbi:hypothetical protein [Streptomyces sp. NPDC056387]|uniref:hypothetical protein n=1 Tax=Streptomyces sp. NPDC056387 TaxID=3345803 RepID=UPI0035D55F0A